MKAGAMSVRRANANPCRVAWIVALALVVSIASPDVLSLDPPTNGEPAAPEISAATCPFCLTPFRTKDDFCSKCGRLARLTATSAKHRFWGDAVYADFARFGDLPKLEAELASDGLVREVVTFNSGSRIEMSKGKKGFVIAGKVSGSDISKEDSYSAKMTAKLDGEGRLIQRLIWAKRNGDPDTYLYRVVDYQYTPDGLLDQIQRLSTVLRKDHVDLLANSQDLLGLNGDVAGLSLRTAHRLMNHDARIRKAKTLALCARCQ